MATKRLCKLCGENPATIPDRESMSMTNRVCRECHMERLRGDFRRVLLAHAEDRKSDVSR